MYIGTWGDRYSLIDRIYMLDKLKMAIAEQNAQQTLII